MPFPRWYTAPYCVWLGQGLGHFVLREMCACCLHPRHTFKSITEIMALFYNISTRFQYGTRTKGHAIVGYIPGHLRCVVQGYHISETCKSSCCTQSIKRVDCLTCLIVQGLFSKVAQRKHGSADST